MLQREEEALIPTARCCAAQERADTAAVDYEQGRQFPGASRKRS